MSKDLRKVLSDEVHRRHGYRFMEAKLKPVHIANSLIRREHESVGKMAVMEQLFEATLNRNPLKKRIDATRALIESHPDRWGRLAETEDLKTSPLLTKILPLIRTLLGVDGAVFGSSPEWSSFSSPSSLTVTTDASDDGAGTFIHRLWAGIAETDRLPILDMLNELTSPDKAPSSLDDISALLIPLADGIKKRSFAASHSEDLSVAYSPVELQLRSAALSLTNYETKLRPNPIASLQRIVLLATLSVFVHAASRQRERYGTTVHPLLVDATGDRYSSIADASTRSVSQLLADGRSYMAYVIRDILRAVDPAWFQRPLEVLNILLQGHGRPPVESTSKSSEKLLDIVLESDPDELEGELSDELIRMIEGNSGRGLDGYLRLLGVRAGLLYPQQKNPNKRVIPTDRTLEVLVASTIDVESGVVEYRDFLKAFRERWGMIVGGLSSDAADLAAVGWQIPSRELSLNSDRYLSRLEAIGLARRLADSVAVVGLLEDNYE